MYTASERFSRERKHKTCPERNAGCVERVLTLARARERCYRRRLLFHLPLHATLEDTTTWWCL
jgi:hypothetical protein|eukprot:COSAG01_NODE_5650_length_4116_cov_5.166003_4_plen_63_part_00